MATTSLFRTALRPVTLALAGAGLAGALLAGCGQANSAPAATGAPAGGPPITAAVVLEQPVNETQEFSGRLEAVDQVAIRARVSGFITATHFQPGSEVKQGQLLFVIDPRPYEAEAARAAAAAGAARAKADLAKLEFARAERLLADKAIAQRELDEKAAAVKELDATARAAQASADAARLNLSYTRVTAPIRGRVSKAEVTVGNLVDGNVVLTSVVSSNPIYASFDGDEATYLRLGRAARGSAPVAVRIGLAGEAGFPHAGKLEFVDNKLDASTGSVRMRAVLANPDGVLVPGLFARVQLAGSAQTGHRAILISERAVGTDQDRKFVFVVGADSKAEYRPVVLGPNVAGLRVVRSGLKPGERIIIDGLQRVQPGAPVTAAVVPMVATRSGLAKVATLDAPNKE